VRKQKILNSSQKKKKKSREQKIFKNEKPLRNSVSSDNEIGVDILPD
jgi:hypothetical protein